MDFPAYYRGNVTYIEHDDVRLDAIVDIVAGLAPQSTLDLGCGTGWLARRLLDRVGGTVVGLDILTDVSAAGWGYVTADLTSPLPFRDSSFSCVVAGEVIEHVPDPDAVLREIHRVLAADGTLVISTPNMVSWANRILVPLGIQPLGTETSSSVALGRRWRLLGQGNQVQGHLKVFTHRALAEILERYGFQVTARLGMPAEFPFPVSLADRFFRRFVPLASDLLYVARRVPVAGGPTPPEPYDPRRRRWSRRR
jgi:ubiquinone/menaquinone biosynthesis C-methylase UbiE